MTKKRIIKEKIINLFKDNINYLQTDFERFEYEDQIDFNHDNINNFFTRVEKVKRLLKKAKEQHFQEMQLIAQKQKEEKQRKQELKDQLDKQVGSFKNFVKTTNKKF